jgi:hypothetical protein
MAEWKLAESEAAITVFELLMIRGMSLETY